MGCAMELGCSTIMINRSIKENGSRICEMDKVSFSSKMVNIIEENGIHKH